MHLGPYFLKFLWVHDRKLKSVPEKEPWTGSENDCFKANLTFLNKKIFQNSIKHMLYLHIMWIYFKYKKVLLRERKRHTARRVASARYAALSNGGGAGGYPIQSWWGEGGTPIQSWWGVPKGTTHHPDLARGYPGYPPTIHTWTGVPPHHPHLAGSWGTPSLSRVPLPLSRPGMGYPTQTWSTPTQTCDRVPPWPRLGMGSPLTWDRVPCTQTWDWIPPQTMVNRQTFPSINITFPRTMYAGGNNSLNLKTYVIQTLPVMSISVILYSVLVGPVLVLKFRLCFRCINFPTISRDKEIQTTEPKANVTIPKINPHLPVTKYAVHFDVSLRLPTKKSHGYQSDGHCTRNG